MNKKYIQMVLSLPEEFFAGWEWNAGDRAITLPFKREVMIVTTNLLIQINKPNMLSVIHPDSDLITHDMYKIEDLRPLPSQKQLQEMMNLSPIKFIEDLFEFASEPISRDLDLSIFSIDMDCFTLAYVMDRKFKRWWNGEKWV